MHFMLKKILGGGSRSINERILLERKNIEGLVKGVIELTPYERHVSLYVVSGEVNVMNNAGNTCYYKQGYGTWLYVGYKLDLGENGCYALESFNITPLK